MDNVHNNSHICCSIPLSETDLAQNKNRRTILHPAQQIFERQKAFSQITIIEVLVPRNEIIPNADITTGLGLITSADLLKSSISCGTFPSLLSFSPHRFLTLLLRGNCT